MTIHVALAQASGVLGDLLASVIKRDPEFDLIARVKSLSGIAALSRDRELDAVIVCTPDGSVPQDADRLLAEDGCDTVVAVSTDGKRASLRRRDGSEARLDGLSPAELLDGIRSIPPVNEGPPDA